MPTVPTDHFNASHRDHASESGASLSSRPGLKFVSEAKHAVILQIVLDSSTPEDIFRGLLCRTQNSTPCRIAN